MDKEIILKVIDNGCGMTSDVISGLLNTPYRSAKQRGFGLRNVNERLKMHYGVDHGLSIKSTINSGTSVEVRIPFRLSENAEQKLIHRGNS
ncbi:MAG: hypothetical protein GX800_00955 [Clostridiaceae bacterium]|jgi:sensor histidine kinase YesM|nr:hypothetical protein [Clostridiaceae bacterium]